jgi:ribonucleoside-diphosphate reductase alpha chain
VIDKIEHPWYGSDSASINWQERVELQSIVQRYTTHSISSTVNLPKETSEELISEIYLEAWSRGLKGITVYRDGSRDGILNSVDKEEYSTVAIVEHSAPKRPKVLPADLHVVTSNKIKYAVVIGLLDNKPYEVFAFEFNPLFLNGLKNFSGTITKVKKGKYRFESEFAIFENLQVLNENRIEEKACTLYTSMLLRHGASIPFIIKTARKVNDGITSFSSAMCRVLGKYTPKEDVQSEKCPECGGGMIREAGCTKCTDCGHSHCLLIHQIL